MSKVKRGRRPPSQGGRRRDTLRGGEGGKDRRSRSARVVDPGLFYALRAVTRVVLWFAEGSPSAKEPVRELLKLKVWLEQAVQWDKVIAPSRMAQPGEDERRRAAWQDARRRRAMQTGALVQADLAEVTDEELKRLDAEVDDDEILEEGGDDE